MKKLLLSLLFCAPSLFPADDMRLVTMQNLWVRSHVTANRETIKNLILNDSQENSWRLLNEHYIPLLRDVIEIRRCQEESVPMITRASKIQDFNNFKSELNAILRSKI
jgi:uncharacterized protein YehS (DUF1456 family)